MDVTIGCYKFMGQCRTLDDDVTIGCYYGDYSYVTTPFLHSFIFGTIFFAHTCLHHYCSKHVLLTAKLCMHINYCHTHYFIAILYKIDIQQVAQQLAFLV